MIYLRKITGIYQDRDIQDFWKYNIEIGDYVKIRPSNLNDKRSQCSSANGVITGITSDNTYNIQLDDGNIRNNVSQECIFSESPQNHSLLGVSDAEFIDQKIGNISENLMDTYRNDIDSIVIAFNNSVISGSSNLFQGWKQEPQFTNINGKKFPIYLENRFNKVNNTQDQLFLLYQLIKFIPFTSSASAVNLDNIRNILYNDVYVQNYVNNSNLKSGYITYLELVNHIINQINVLNQFSNNVMGNIVKYNSYDYTFYNHNSKPLFPKRFGKPDTRHNIIGHICY